MTDTELKSFLATYEQFARINREIADAAHKDAQAQDIPAARTARAYLAGAAIATALIGGLSGLVALFKSAGWL